MGADAEIVDDHAGALGRQGERISAAEAVAPPL